MADHDTNQNQHVGTRRRRFVRLLLRRDPALLSRVMILGSIFPRVLGAEEKAALSGSRKVTNPRQ